MPDVPPPPSSLWRAFFRDAPSGLLVLAPGPGPDGGGRRLAVIDVNERGLELLGLEREEVLGRGCDELCPDPELEPLDEGLLALLEEGGHLVSERAVRRDGGEAWFAVTAVAAEGAVIVQLESITQRKTVLSEAVKLMNHDDLTGVGNRRLLRARFFARRDRGTDTALLYLDLDGFKEINDRHGHDLGDEVLRVVAQRLRKNVRPHELVARLGGDEFAVLLDAGDEAAVAGVRRRLEEAVAEPMNLRGVRLALGASVGWALHDADGATFEALLSAADRRMYEEKRSRKSRA